MKESAGAGAGGAGSARGQTYRYGRLESRRASTNEKSDEFAVRGAGCVATSSV